MHAKHFLLHKKVIHKLNWTSETIKKEIKYEGY
jgi:hypothetical protein